MDRRYHGRAPGANRRDSDERKSQTAPGSCGLPTHAHPVMNPPPVPQRVLALSLLLGLWGLSACQGKSEPDPPRTPRPVIEARSFGSSVARIVAGHPCRAEVEGEELLIGTEPLVAQVGNSRWSGITSSAGSDAGTTLSRDGQPVVRIRDVAGPEHGDGVDDRGLPPG